MSRRAILALSAVVTAFVLVVAGAVAGRSLPAPSSAEVAKASDAIPADVVRAREAELRRLIDEANARLGAQQATAPAPIAEPASAPLVRGHDDDRRGHHAQRVAHREDDDG